MAAGPCRPLNVWEDENDVYAEADLPGLDPAKLEVTVTEGNQLTIQGERGPGDPGAVWVRQERPFGKFTRVVTLPALVDADEVEAKYENGVLAADPAQARGRQAPQDRRQGRVTRVRTRTRRNHSHNTSRR